jgi:hypothetical protein
MNQSFTMPTNCESMNPLQEKQESKVLLPCSNLATVSVHGALALGRKRPETLSHSHDVAPKRRRVYAPRKHVRFATDLHALMDLLPDDLANFQTWDARSVQQQGRLAGAGGGNATKRVRFALQLESFAPEIPLLLDETVETTWYTDLDYYNFKLDSRYTILAARRKLLSTGTVSDHDDTQDCTLLGLEHFLSRTLEQARADRCRRHVEQILALHNHQPALPPPHQLWGRHVHFL